MLTQTVWLKRPRWWLILQVSLNLYEILPREGQKTHPEAANCLDWNGRKTLLLSLPYAALNLCCLVCTALYYYVQFYRQCSLHYTVLRLTLHTSSFQKIGTITIQVGPIGSRPSLMELNPSQNIAPRRKVRALCPWGSSQRSTQNHFLGHKEQ